MKIWEGLFFMNACWVSQSVFYEVLNTVNDDVLKMVTGYGEIMFHLAFKRGYWKGCVIRKESVNANYCQVQGGAVV